MEYQSFYTYFLLKRKIIDLFWMIIAELFVFLHLIMNIEHVRNIIEGKQGFENHIGMEFFSTPEPDTCVGRLHVDERTVQPFGFLSGGATLALAETLAGVGSVSLCPDSICMGMNVSGNHLHAARFGETVTATARIIHRGGQTHVWHVDVRNEDDILISTVSVTNFILKKR